MLKKINSSSFVEMFFAFIVLAILLFFTALIIASAFQVADYFFFWLNNAMQKV